MSKLTKAQIKAHDEAVALLQKERLSEDDTWTVLENWKESATHINSRAGAFFTPTELARDFAIEVSGSRIIDLCAGIGALSFMARQRALWGGGPEPEIVCVEINPDYIAVGQKVLPQATWIQADIFNLPDLGRFDCAISNPPFGATKRSGRAPRYSGKSFDLHVIDIASDLADYGTFIVPQMSAPFEYSGRDHYRVRSSDTYEAFHQATAIELTASCGIDCSVYRNDWNGVAPAVEVVLADFIQARSRRIPTQPDHIEDILEMVHQPERQPIQLDLFKEAAE
ncbi:methyltransferase [Labrys portucalensis]|uniref:Methyltransferase n=1 Tax=Labrys neptuniae TaxID=376174 RepID=A0ABV6Z986_9HYPH